MRTKIPTNVYPSLDHNFLTTSLANKKRSMLGKMAVTDLAKSSFAGVTAQVQCFDCTGMHGAAVVSDMSKNIF